MDTQKCLCRRCRRRRQTKKPTMAEEAQRDFPGFQRSIDFLSSPILDPRRTAHVPDKFFISFDDLYGFRVTDRRH